MKSHQQQCSPSFNQRTDACNPRRQLGFLYYKFWQNTSVEYINNFLEAMLEQANTQNIWVVPVSWHCGHWSPWRFSASRLVKGSWTGLGTWRHFASHLKDISQFRLVGSPWKVNHCQVVYTLICVWGHVWAKRPSWNLSTRWLTCSYIIIVTRCVRIYINVVFIHQNTKLSAK